MNARTLVIIGLLASLALSPAMAAQQPKSTGAGASSPASGKLPATTVQQNPFALIKQFSVDDLNAAILDAQSQNPPDTAAITCYTALLTVVNTNVANPLPASPGAFQALQKARDAKVMMANLVSPNGPLSALNNACAPLILDAQNTLLGLGVAVGLVANPVGAAGVGSLAGIGGLGAAITTFLALPKL
jgi:hypothetical protein